MLLSQTITSDGRHAAVVRQGTEAHEIEGVSSTLELALSCIAAGQTLAQRLQTLRPGPAVDLGAALAEGRVLPPLTHPDPAHMLITGTGLTHLGSAATRDTMHKAAALDQIETLTDSMRMFRMGVDGGKPGAGRVGVQPEWFFKGDGSCVVPPGAALDAPPFASDGGEEPEIAGLYVIGPDGAPFRLGFALANEFSDHAMEKVNYLYLAHSKLRQTSFGPEILVGPLPADLRGISRIRRGGQTVFEQPFLSGESNMSHTIANLEHHHFKYDQFRRPGDVHVHMFGTATLSFAAGFKTRDGDVFEIEAPEFGLPLSNRLTLTDPATAKFVAVQAL
ncbi:AraD1 family protein [Paracoccus pacificus]|uniref:AraD1 family protein n=1 Tax=Paracoccus pacificus TaxID=1463598 RepID=A0ABW4R779_9RHOB